MLCDCFFAFTLKGTGLSAKNVRQADYFDYIIPQYGFGTASLNVTDLQ